MRMIEIAFDGATPVDGYGPGFFRVAQQVIEGAVLVTMNSARSWGGYDDTGPLLALAQDVDVIFIGTGAETAHAPAALRDSAGRGRDRGGGDGLSRRMPHLQRALVRGPPRCARGAAGVSARVTGFRRGPGGSGQPAWC